MIAWTTPTLEILLQGIDLTEHELTVTIAQDSQYGSVRIDIGDPEVTLEGGSTLVTVTLTQEQTGRLAQGKARIQVNAIDSSGTRLCSDEAEVTVGRNLLDHAISYGG